MPAAVLSGPGLRARGPGPCSHRSDAQPRHLGVGGTRALSAPHPCPTRQGLVREREVRSCSPEASWREEGEARNLSQLSRERERNRDKWRGSMGDGRIDRAEKHGVMTNGGFEEGTQSSCLHPPTHPGARETDEH